MGCSFMVGDSSVGVARAVTSGTPPLGMDAMFGKYLPIHVSVNADYEITPSVLHRTILPTPLRSCPPCRRREMDT